MSKENIQSSWRNLEPFNQSVLIEDVIAYVFQRAAISYPRIGENVKIPIVNFLNAVLDLQNKRTLIYKLTFKCS